MRKASGMTDDRLNNPEIATKTRRTKPRPETRPPADAPKPAPVAFSKSAESDWDDVERVTQSLPAAQRDRVLELASRTKSRGRGTDMKLSKENGTLTVNFGHAYPEAAALMIMAEMGTMDTAFFLGVTGQIARIGAQGTKNDEGNSNFLLSVVRAVQPRDELEAMLAVQMGAIHAATMMMAQRLNHVDTVPQQNSTEQALNKLARTYAMQMEALKRYRTGGQQRVIVEHVTVNAGGQAIVGAVTTGGGG